MKQAFEIADDIVKLIQGEITPEELEKLDQWLELSPENRALLASLMDEKKFEQEKNKYSKEYLAQRFELVAKKKKNLRYRRVLRRWSVAAACLVCIISGYWFYTMHSTQSENMLAVTDDEATFSHNAYLLLSSGEKLFLNENLLDTLNAKYSSHKIIMDHGEVRVEQAEGDSVSETLYHTLEVPLRSEYNLLLPDGSRVFLNAGSRLSFPSQFSENQRVVKLSGEAYFEVARNEQKPFVVCTDAVRVKVLGTEFAIRNYVGKPILTTLVKGKVEVEDSTGWRAILNPGEQVFTDNGSSEVRTVETIYYTSWKDGYFMFSNMQLKDIMDELSQWYGYSCFFQNQDVAELRISARLKKYDRIDNLLELLERTHEIQIEKTGNVIVVGSGIVK